MSEGCRILVKDILIAANAQQLIDKLNEKKTPLEESMNILIHAWVALNFSQGTSPEKMQETFSFLLEDYTKVCKAWEAQNG